MAGMSQEKAVFLSAKQTLSDGEMNDKRNNVLNALDNAES
jgi:hypothetical protein